MGVRRQGVFVSSFSSRGAILELVGVDHAIVGSVDILRRKMRIGGCDAMKLKTSEVGVSWRLGNVVRDAGTECFDEWGRALSITNCRTTVPMRDRADTIPSPSFGCRRVLQLQEIT